jgi:hypothetical protein
MASREEKQLIANNVYAHISQQAVSDGFSALGSDAAPNSVA